LSVILEVVHCIFQGASFFFSIYDQELYKTNILQTSISSIEGINIPPRIMAMNY